MDSPLRPDRLAKRLVLAERQPRLQPPTPSKAMDLLDSSPRMPHHESLKPECNLSVRNKVEAFDSKFQDKRVPAVAEVAAPSSKRDSQASATSSISATKSKRKTHVGPWQLGKTLGKGATGRVRLAKHSLTGQTSAIKIVSKKSAAVVQSASLKQITEDETAPIEADARRNIPFGIEREVVIMKLIEHPNVINLYDIWENRGELYLVLEYVEGGELFDYVSTNGALPEVEAIRLFRQIIAGLSYCHRFNICHRDLKPENILLDRNKNIKLADFGMAALQPANKWLNTSCGSPHYAAPEIIMGHQYIGSRADIWSVGIILFAMLNGFLPFDGGDLNATLRLVKKGDYYLPESLSIEASDLIQRILQKRPEKRINMEDIWTHPLIRKWERYHASLVAPEQLIGPPPPLTSTECGQKIRRTDLDSEIMRNLRTLWHGEKQEELVQKLTSDEPNHEKLFYSALVNFRDEQLENYPGDCLQHSNSDYHHIKKPSPKPKRPNKCNNHIRRPSQFSIVSDESHKRDSYYKNPITAVSKTTQGSYDPYRASKTPIIEHTNQGTVIVKHTEGSHSHSSSNTASLRHPAVSRLQNGPSSLPTIDSDELERMIEKKRRSYSTATSRSSLASSRRGGIRKSRSHKRQVSFQHRRQNSTSTLGKSRADEYQPTISPDASYGQPLLQDSIQDLSDQNYSNLSLSTPPHVAQPPFAVSELHLKKPRVASYYWKEETRKVSSELGKICEEAFNRSSISSASGASPYRAVDSPATTWSTTDLTAFGAFKNRPLPLTPVLRELTERRQKIIETWGDANPGTLAELVATLDRHIEEEKQKANEIRSASDPTYNARLRTARLPYEINTMEDLSGRPESSRAASDPTRYKDNRTIRLVTPDPTSPISRPEHSIIRKEKAKLANSIRSSSEHLTISTDRSIHETRFYNRPGLDTIEEDPKSPKLPGMDYGLSRKWSWLGKKVAGSQEDLPPTPPRKDQAENLADISTSVSANSSNFSRNESSEVPAAVEEKRKWFQKMFSRNNKKHELFHTGQHEIVDNALDDTESMETAASTRNGKKTRKNYPPVNSVQAAAAADAIQPIEIQQNWFARFFRVKPATRMVVVQLSKVKVRKELIKILRDWRKYGIRDVTVERRGGADIVRARVDSCNYLHIKPVDFHVHLYTVLERGRNASLSIMKFTQEKGAASSFHRVVDTLESVLREDDSLVVNEQRKKAILRTMKESGL